jgi:hypothetical protein
VIGTPANERVSDEMKFKNMKLTDWLEPEAADKANSEAVTTLSLQPPAIAGSHSFNQALVSVEQDL